jgi:hypothetical protein
MNKIILGGDTVQIELIDGEENTSGTWIVEHDEDDINSNVLVSDECDTIEINDAIKVAMEDMDSEGELSELDMVETEEFIEFG